MNINQINEQIKQLEEQKEQMVIASCSKSPWVIGTKYFVRTVTMHITGKLKAVYDNQLVFSDAAWVADSGRFSDALEMGVLEEVEPFANDVIVGIGAIVDCTEWTHDLPREKK